MLTPLFIDYLLGLNWAEQLLWAAALVATLLSVILGVMHFFGFDFQQDLGKTGQQVDARQVLIFFTFFGWSSILAHLWVKSLLQVFIYAFPVAFFAAILPLFISRIRRKRRQSRLAELFDIQGAVTSTGEVLQDIPPNRHGFGKVHLNIRQAPYAIDAVSVGGALTRGVPVRVIEVLADEVVVVEPLDGVGPEQPPSVMDPAQYRSNEAPSQGGVPEW